MILIAGIPDEPPVAMAIEAAEQCGIGHVLLDQRDHASARLAMALDPLAGWRARLILPDAEIELDRLSGAYLRLMDERFLPDVRDLADHAPARQLAIRFHRMLLEWCNIAAVRIANRPRAMLSNGSKTFQADLIRRCGFAIPETLVTNDPDEALAFVAHCAAEGDEVIYKSISGARSIVQTFSPEDRERLHRIRWCPTQFQRKVRGTDMRVHVIGQSCFAARITSEATDYRYARRQTGEDAELAACEPEPGLANGCIRLAATLGLAFAGIDLRMTPEGETVCFEVNPSPAYSYYQSRTGAPIAEALVRWLGGEGARP